MAERELVADLRFASYETMASLEGPPDALRRLAQLLRNGGRDAVEVTLGDGRAVLRQTSTSGPFRVAVEGHAMEVTGSSDRLAILWDALEGVAEEADSMAPAPVARHQHIEYLGPGDQYRAEDSFPLVVGADWPG